MKYIIILLIYALIVGTWIRLSVINNMQDAYLDGCFDAAKKLAILDNDLRLYVFCKAKRLDLHEFYWK